MPTDPLVVLIWTTLSTDHPAIRLALVKVAQIHTRIDIIVYSDIILMV